MTIWVNQNQIVCAGRAFLFSGSYENPNINAVCVVAWTQMRKRLSDMNLACLLFDPIRVEKDVFISSRHLCGWLTTVRCARVMHVECSQLNLPTFICEMEHVLRRDWGFVVKKKDCRQSLSFCHSVRRISSLWQDGSRLKSNVWCLYALMRPLFSHPPLQPTHFHTHICFTFLFSHFQQPVSLCH